MSTPDYKGRMPEDIPEEERSLVKDLLDRVRRRREAPDYERLLKKIPYWRRYTQGREWEEYESDDFEHEDIVRANLIGSALANAVPRIYARNPEISVTPTEAVVPARYQLIRRFGQTMQITLNNQFGPTQARLKKRAKSNIRSGLTTSMGWMKVTLQMDIQQDPIVQSRINDLQDNLQHINALIADIENDEERGEHEAKREELHHAIAAFQGQTEVARATGIIIDRVLTENMTVSSEVTDVDAYLDAEWIDERIEMSRERCKRLFGFVPDSATVYTQNNKGEQRKSEGKRMSETERDARENVCIHEFWHRSTNTVYTLCEGYRGYMKDPAPPAYTGERWYPYFLWAPIPSDGEFVPACYVEQLIELQDEYNETRTNLRDHRKKNIPHWIGLKGSVSESDANAIKNAEAFECVLIDGEPGQPIRNYLDLMQQPPIDPAVYDTSQVRVDFELISGQGDAARGVIAKPKTLGEAEIIEQGLATRMGDMQDANEDMIQEIAQYAAEIMLTAMTPQQIERIVGPGAVWPQLTREEAFDMVQIEIRAGSTGKPDKQREREVWIEFMPILRDTIIQVSEARATGNTDMADALIKLMQESMRRFDERIDVEEFLPQRKEGEVDPVQMQQMQARQEAARQQAEMLKAQISEIWSKTVKNLADAEAAEAGAQFDQYMEQMKFLANMLQPAPAAKTTLQ